MSSWFRWFTCIRWLVALTACATVTLGLAQDNTPQRPTTAPYNQLVRTLTTAQPGTRMHLQALDGLAQLYENQGRHAESLRLTQQALLPLRADAQARSGDLHIALEWRLGRLYHAMGQDAQSLAAYQRTVDRVEQLRQDIPIDYADGQSSFRTTFEPIYLGLIDGLLRSTAVLPGLPANAHEAVLRRARDAVERIKQTELQDYLGDRCVVDAVKGGSATVIPPRTAVLYPILFADRLELLLETATGIQRFTTPTARTAVQQVASTLSRELRSERGNYMAPARQLYDMLLKPLDGAMAANGIDTLVVVPDATLRTIPLGALHDGSRFAIEKYAITTATGMSMTNTSTPPKAAMTALIAGASRFGGVVEKYATTRLSTLLDGPATQGTASSRMLRSARSSAASEALNALTAKAPAAKLEAMRNALALPGVTREVQALQGILPGISLIDSGFTVDAFRQAASSVQYRIVHVASHGVFGGTADSSYILAYDDLLTLDGLQNLLKGEQFQKAPIEILSLSACETAAGNDRAPLGISGAAMKARARSVLGTLWPVDDEAAVGVMTQFYKGVVQQGQTKAQSLQQSKIQLIRNPQLAHPFFWAPFELIGNWL